MILSVVCCACEQNRNTQLVICLLVVPVIVCLHCLRWVFFSWHWSNFNTDWGHTSMMLGSHTTPWRMLQAKHILVISSSQSSTPWSSCMRNLRSRPRERKTINADHAGGLSSMWWEGLQVIWVVRWSTNANRGLQPVRPFIAVKQNVSIQPQQAISLAMNAAPVQ